MTESEKIITCHRCQFAGRAANGRKPCTADAQARDILHHVTHGTCPKGKHDGEIIASSIPLAGDVVAGITARFGIDRLAKFVAKLAGKKDCKCASRRAWLNRLDRRVRRLVGG